MEFIHQPVLYYEVLEYLRPVPGGIYVDCTVGSAGHSQGIGNALSGKGRLICLDKDPDAVRLSRERLSFMGDRVSVYQANYADLDEIVKEREIEALNGALLDLGMSAYQLEKSGRGFSFLKNERLDMRMDPNDGTTAYQLVNHLPERDLEKILRAYGEEKKARLITRVIVQEREKRPIETSFQLAGVIKAAIPTPPRSRARHPATQTFQAIRIAVNRELQNIETFLKKIPLLMAEGGRLIVLSYHSLEDRQIKQSMVNWERPCSCPADFPHCVCGKTPLFRRLNKKGVKPSQKEIEKNPRARSAILRAAERI